MRAAHIIRVTYAILVFFGLAGQTLAQAPGASGLSVTGFGGDFNLSAVDADATPDGQQRLIVLEGTGRNIYKELNKIETVRGPLAAQRLNLAKQVFGAQMLIRDANIVFQKNQRTLSTLQRQANVATGVQQQRLQAQINALTNENSAAEAAARNATATINRLTPEINVLDGQLAPLNEQRKKLWNELEECRKQWVAIRQPLEKYSRGDIELLRRVLDDWLLIDGLWPQALTWGALCAYEMGDLPNAADYWERAERVRVEVLELPAQWPAMAALQGLILKKMPRKAVQGNKAIAEALKLIDKDNDWEAYYLLGLVYSERDSDHFKAKTHFENALRVNPRCLCAEVALARLQTTSKHEKVADSKAGTTTLERVWQKTGKRSWRLAYNLVRAYDGQLERTKAAELWAFVEANAPSDLLDQLKADRQSAGS